MEGNRIGEVTHFYNRISVAVLALTDTIRLGETVRFLGHTTDFRQQVISLQIEHQSVDEARPGQDVAMEVEQRVRRGDMVFKLSETT